MSGSPIPVADPGGELQRSALESLARAARQTALYGPEHSITTKSLEQAWRELGAEAAGGAIRLGVTAAALTWNGRMVIGGTGHLTRLHRALRERLVSSIRFSPELRLADLARLLVVLSEDPKLLAASGGVTRALAEAIGPSLVVEDVDCTTRVGEGEAFWLQTCNEVDPQMAKSLREVLSSCLQMVRTAGDTKALDQARSALSEHLGEVSRDTSQIEAVASTAALLIQSAGEAAARAGPEVLERWRQETICQLRELGAEWTARIFRAPLAVEISGDVLAQLAQQMEVPECVAAVLEFPGAIATERSEGLLRVLQRVMSDPLRAAEIGQALREAARLAGIPEEVYQNVVGLVMPQAIARQSGEVMGGPEAGPRPDSAAEAREELADLFETLAGEATRRSYAEALLGLLDLDLSANQYGTVMRALLALISTCAGQGDTELLVSVLERLQEEVSEDRARSPGRRAMAMSAIARSGDRQVVSYITKALERSPADRQERLLFLLGHLGEEGMQALCQFAGHSVDPMAKPALLALARCDGPVYMNLRRLLADLPPADLEHALRVLAELGDRSVYVQFGAAAGRRELSARMTLIRALRASGNAAAAEALVPLLTHAEPEVRAAAAEALGELGATDAVPALCYLLGREADRGQSRQVKAAAARALGKIGSPEAVSALGELLRGGGFISGWLLEPARLAAVEALSLIGTPAARQELEEWRRCRHRRLQEACRRALSSAPADPDEGGEDAP